jgi:hypothetical protein
LAQGRARTVVYLHGIGNKPPAEVLRCQWDRALFGREMGERTRMAYWVSRERYPSPEPGGCQDQDHGPALNQAEQRVLGALGVVPQLADLRQLADTLAGSDAERACLQQLLDEVQAAAPEAAGLHAQGPIDVLNRMLLKLISAALLQDVHDFFFVPARREQMRKSLLRRMRAGGGPFVVVAHSQGSLIAYDVLRAFEAEGCEVSLLLTLGSPLGLPVVRSMFKQWSGTPKLPFPPCVKRWVNVAERRDPVALDDDLSDDIADAHGRFHNIAGSRINPDWQRNPHSASGYLSIPEVRAEVRRAVGVGFDQPIAHPVLIKDLSDQLEARAPDYRHEVLIELDRLPGERAPAQLKRDLVAALRALTEVSTGLQGDALDAAIELEDTLQRYVSVRLTRFEIESLRDRCRGLSLKRLWRDAGKRALIYSRAAPCRPTRRRWRTVRSAPASAGRCWTAASPRRIRISSSPVCPKRSWRNGTAPSAAAPANCTAAMAPVSPRWTATAMAPTWPGSSPGSARRRCPAWRRPRRCASPAWRRRRGCTG